MRVLRWKLLIVSALLLPAIPLYAQTPSAPPPAMGETSSGKVSAETSANKASKSKTSVKKPATKQVGVAGPAERGPCQIGVIPVIGDKFALQHVGLTVFGNESSDAPIESWGLDDLVVARVRAAAAGRMSVRRVAYSKEALQDAGSKEPAGAIRALAGNASCERYLVVTKSSGQVAGTNQRAAGVGLLTNWASGAMKSGSLYAF